MMTKQVRLLLLVPALVLSLSMGVYFYGKWAIHQIQPFYATALQLDSEALTSGSQQMESRVSSLVSDAAESETWQAVFSDNEVNGWFATTLEEKFPDLLPDSVSDLRVAFFAKSAAIGFRYNDPDIDTVVSIRLNALVKDPDVIAARLHSVHAGKLPIPMKRVVESITLAAREQQIAIQWTQQEGDPVVLIPIKELLSTAGIIRELTALEFHQGELYIAGSTQNAAEAVAEKSATKLER